MALRGGAARCGLARCPARGGLRNRASAHSRRIRRLAVVEAATTYIPPPPGPSGGVGATHPRRNPCEESKGRRRRRQERDALRPPARPVCAAVPPSKGSVERGQARNCAPAGHGAAGPDELLPRSTTSHSLTNGPSTTSHSLRGRWTAREAAPFSHHRRTLRADISSLQLMGAAKARGPVLRRGGKAHYPNSASPPKRRVPGAEKALLPPVETISNGTRRERHPAAPQPQHLEEPGCAR